MASRGESHGLGDVQRDTQLSTVLESLTQTLGVGFKHSFEPRTARPFRLFHRAAGGDEREAVGEVEDHARAVHGGGRRRVVGRGGGVGESPNGEEESESDSWDRHFLGREMNEEIFLCEFWEILEEGFGGIVVLGELWVI